MSVSQTSLNLTCVLFIRDSFSLSAILIYNSIQVGDREKFLNFLIITQNNFSQFTLMTDR